MPAADVDTSMLNGVGAGSAAQADRHPSIVRIPAVVSSGSGDVSTGYEAVGAKRR